MYSLKFRTRAFRNSAAAVFVTLAIASSATDALAKQKYVTFDITGAGTQDGQGTFPMAMNAKGVIAGEYVDSDAVPHGFFGKAAGPFTTFDEPNAVLGAGQGTVAKAIDTAGDVAGYYVDSHMHGFVRHSDGSYDGFSIATDTIPVAINSAGTVTGSANTAGFIRSKKGKVIQFSVTGAATTNPMAITSTGVVAGFYYDNSNFKHGFIRAKNGTITTFDVGGIFENTHVDSINSAGDVAGYAYVGSTYAGFVRTADGTVTPFSASTDCPATFGAGINMDGSVVGSCFNFNDFVYHGFIRNAAGATTVFSSTNAGTVGGTGTFPTAVITKGRTVGYAEDGNGVSHGFQATGLQ